VDNRFSKRLRASHAPINILAFPRPVKLRHYLPGRRRRCAKGSWREGDAGGEHGFMKKRQPASAKIGSRINELISANRYKELEHELMECVCVAWGQKLPINLLEPLGTLLSHKNKVLVRYAINIIATYKAKATGLVPGLLKVANTRKGGWEAPRFCAVQAIWDITRDADLVAPFLVQCVEDFPEEASDLIVKMKRHQQPSYFS
jgi:hypothetical protein